jgi:hypothetical protein
MKFETAFVCAVLLSFSGTSFSQQLATSGFEPNQGFTFAPVSGQGTPQWFEGSALNTLRVDTGGRGTGQAIKIDTAQYVDPVYAWVDVRNKSISSQSKIVVATAYVSFSDDNRAASVAGMDLFEATGSTRFFGIRIEPIINFQGGVKLLLGNQEVATTAVPPFFWTWTKVRLYVDLEQAKGWAEVGNQVIGRDAPYTLPASFIANVTRIADADLFVDPKGYNVISFDDYKVEAIQAGQVSGKVTLNDWSATTAGIPVTIQVRNASNVVVETKNTTLAADGSFAVSVAYRGQGYVSAKCSHWLGRRSELTTITRYGVLDFEPALDNADIDGDDIVSILDYISLSNAFGSEKGDPGWNAMNDLDGDDLVSILDYIILSANFGMEANYNF